MNPHLLPFALAFGLTALAGYGLCTLLFDAKGKAEVLLYFLLLATVSCGGAAGLLVLVAAWQAAL